MKTPEQLKGAIRNIAVSKNLRCLSPLTAATLFSKAVC